MFALLTLLVLAPPAWTAQPNGSGCPTVTVCFTPGENCTQTIVQALGAAKQTIVAQAYSFTSAPIAKGLLDAHKRGHCQLIDEPIQPPHDVAYSSLNHGSS